MQCNSEAQLSQPDSKHQTASELRINTNSASHWKYDTGENVVHRKEYTTVNGNLSSRQPKNQTSRSEVG
ncbi:hypothetical protein T265_12287 [Opisthorchis viverrini]|uniref:Uncharacterized protein n=1 Tax=Opisthorchis viverrini TaxID=6198 RepID=A0A074YYW5_OPIVI|nr:hypothetical protein T265_12287 [Opisthorchis viverrini]KER18392.1 hypothetical protein T265_12287 [Opisthorchis viverrini]